SFVARRYDFDNRDDIPVPMADGDDISFVQVAICFTFSDDTGLRREVCDSDSPIAAVSDVRVARQSKCQYVWIGPANILLNQSEILTWQTFLIQGCAKANAPSLMKMMKESSVHFCPVVNRHKDSGEMHLNAIIWQNRVNQSLRLRSWQLN